MFAIRKNYFSIICFKQYGWCCFFIPGVLLWLKSQNKAGWNLFQPASGLVFGKFPFCLRDNFFLYLTFFFFTNSTRKLFSVEIIVFALDLSCHIKVIGLDVFLEDCGGGVPCYLHNVIDVHS